jgi:hypothetical protein
MDTFSGTYSAVVVDANDPTGAGRVRLYVPQVHGEAVTGWAAPVVPGLPQAGDQVEMTYAGSDQNYPVYWPSRPLVSSVNGIQGDVQITAPIVGATPAPGPWSTPGYATNWAGGDVGGTFAPLQYRLDGTGSVEIACTMRLTLSSGAAAGTYPITTALPVAFRPARRWRVTGVHVTSAFAFKATVIFGILTAGTLELVIVTAAQNDCFHLYGKFPLV